MLKVYSSINLFDAYIVKDTLNDVGISCFICNEHVSGALGELPYTESWPQVWITQNLHFDRARALAMEFEKNSNTGSVLYCKACNEFGSPGFECCWKCGLDLQPDEG